MHASDKYNGARVSIIVMTASTATALRLCMLYSTIIFSPHILVVMHGMILFGAMSSGIQLRKHLAALPIPPGEMSLALTCRGGAMPGLHQQIWRSAVGNGADRFAYL